MAELTYTLIEDIHTSIINAMCWCADGADCDMVMEFVGMLVNGDWNGGGWCLR